MKPAGCKPWTTLEHKQFIRMEVDGKTNHEISAALGRTVGAIKVRIHDYSLQLHRNRSRALPQVTINQSDVPEWYELGWRFVEFECDRCVFEWRSAATPRFPELRRAAA